MNIPRILLNALMNSGDDKSSHDANTNIRSSPVIPLNLNREILYEGFISIDSMVFISEMNRFNSGFLEEFIRKTVLFVKNLLLDDPMILNELDNYQDRIDHEDQQLKAALELRNKYLNDDGSMIARELVRKKYEELKLRIRGRLDLYDEDKDGEYIGMMKRLMNAEHEDHGIYEAIKREMVEFYGEKIKVPESLVLDARISLSIGGAIFIPNVLMAVMRRLNVQNKAELINNMLLRILAPSEELVSRMNMKSFTERKSIVLDFLQSCLKRRNGPFKDKIDIAFGERTRILEMYLKDDPRTQEKLRILDRLQEHEIKKLISAFKNIDEDHLMLRLDKPVIDAYGNLLGSDKKSTREALYNLFRVE